MLTKILAAVTLAGGALFAASAASAMPVDHGAAAGVGAATDVAWYCHRNGNCVQGPRPGYVMRPGWAPGCRAGWRWDGWRCAGPIVVAPRGPVIVGPRPPAVVVRPRGVIIRP